MQQRKSALQYDTAKRFRTMHGKDPLTGAETEAMPAFRAIFQSCNVGDSFNHIYAGFEYESANREVLATADIIQVGICGRDGEAVVDLRSSKTVSASPLLCRWNMYDCGVQPEWSRRRLLENLAEARRCFYRKCQPAAGSSRALPQDSVRFATSGYCISRQHLRCEDTPGN